LEELNVEKMTILNVSTGVEELTKGREKLFE
jgi:hypothetical protein